MSLVLGKDNSLTDDIFIGMRDHTTEGVWKTDESGFRCDVQFTNWNSGQPNNAGGVEDCAAIRKSWNGMWLDIKCNKAHHFLCQVF